jgi:hypothetical protein
MVIASSATGTTKMMSYISHCSGDPLLELVWQRQGDIHDEVDRLFNGMRAAMPRRVAIAAAPPCGRCPSVGQRTSAIVVSGAMARLLRMLPSRRGRLRRIEALDLRPRHQPAMAASSPRGHETGSRAADLDPVGDDLDLHLMVSASSGRQPQREPQ